MFPVSAVARLIARRTRVMIGAMHRLRSLFLPPLLVLLAA